MEFPVASPPWTGLGKSLESLTRKALLEFGLLDGAEGIAVALSGGKDSLSLLYLLKAILGRGVPNQKLIAIHVDGDFSCGAGISGNFLRGICEKMDVPLIVKTAEMKREKLACYSCSRTRRKILFDTAKEHGFHHVAFGHHKDDSLQTLLMNMLHKAEFTANLPKVFMQHYDVTIIRPLIYISEKEIIEFAKMYGFQRITCQCPVGQNSQRKVAEKLLTQMEEAFPHARSNLFQAAQNYGSTKASHP